MYYVKEPNLRDLARSSFQKNFVEISYSVNYFSIKQQNFLKAARYRKAKQS